MSDVTLRIMADKLGPRLGTSVIVDNQPRAGGTTALPPRCRRARDGYTLVTFSSSTAISVSLLKSLPYDPVADFVPVSGLSTFANIIAVNADSKYPTLPKLLQAAFDTPGMLNIGTTTVARPTISPRRCLKSMSGLNFVIVPFRTPGDLLTAVPRNDVDAIVQSYGALKSAIEAQADQGGRLDHPGPRLLCAATCRPSTSRGERLRRGDLERHLRAQPVPRPRSWTH